jgi:uncharacterized protein (DUF983 family)
MMHAPTTDIVPNRPTDSRDPDDRPMRPAMLNGWRRRCPACGGAPLLLGYLRVRDACPACGEALHHQRADDGPAYLTILIVGKLVMVPFYWTFLTWQPDPLLLAGGFSLGAVALSLWLLPRLKGLMVGIQWSRRMHGFGAPPDHTRGLPPSDQST